MIHLNGFGKYLLQLALVALFALVTFATQAQITNLKFSSGSTTYTDIVGGTSLVAGGNVALESSKTLNNERETVTLSTHQIATGVYHLLVETPQSSVISYKIIKE